MSCVLGSNGCDDSSLNPRWSKSGRCIYIHGSVGSKAGHEILPSQSSLTNISPKQDWKGVTLHKKDFEINIRSEQYANKKVIYAEGCMYGNRLEVKR